MTSLSFQANTTLGQPTPLTEEDIPLMFDSFDLYPGVWYAMTADQIQNSCPGDLNGDGDVDEEDLVLFASE
jgi:hypothetical protein